MKKTPAVRATYTSLCIFVCSVPAEAMLGQKPEKPSLYSYLSSTLSSAVEAIDTGARNVAQSAATSWQNTAQYLRDMDLRSTQHLLNVFKETHTRLKLLDDRFQMEVILNSLAYTLNEVKPEWEPRDLMGGSTPVFPPETYEKVLYHKELSQWTRSLLLRGIGTTTWYEVDNGPDRIKKSLHQTIEALRSGRAVTPKYTYSDETFERYPIRKDGDCFFHATKLDRKTVCDQIKKLILENHDQTVQMIRAIVESRIVPANKRAQWLASYGVDEPKANLQLLVKFVDEQMKLSSFHIYGELVSLIAELNGLNIRIFDSPNADLNLRLSDFTSATRFSDQPSIDLYFVNGNHFELLQRVQ